MKAGPGRPKGAPNKTTAALKDMVMQALTKAGGVNYLARQAEKSPAAFIALLGKVIPLQVGTPAGGKLTISWEE